MKQILFTLVFLTTITTVSAQQNLDELLASGVEDAQTFTQQYITPGAEGLLWNTTSGSHYSRFRISNLGKPVVRHVLF